MDSSRTKDVLSRLRRSRIYFANEKLRFARKNIFSWDSREVDLLRFGRKNIFTWDSREVDLWQVYARRTFYGLEKPVLVLLKVFGLKKVHSGSFSGIF